MTTRVATIERKASKIVPATADTSLTPLSTLHDPTLADHEIILQGKVYDISNFDHPGGDIIKGFGALDVTPHYYSIHPFHDSARASRVLAPYYVRDAVLDNHHCSTAYTYDSDFSKELYSTVKRMLPNPFANSEWWAFNISLIAVWLYLFYSMVTSPSVVVAVFYGIAAAMIGLNSHHSSSHGSISPNPSINNAFSVVSDLFGDSKYTWFQQHILSHHPYTNEYHCDSDTRSTEPLFRVNTHKSILYHAYYVYQHLYAWSLFTLLALAKLVPVDTLMYNRYSSDFRVVSYLYERRWYTRFMRVVFISVDILLPLYLHGFVYFFYLAIKMAVGSFMLSALFIISHNFDDVEMISAETKSKDWCKNQVENSCTYGGWLAGMLTGGLNYQIEHHLFPRVNPVHYKTISPVVRAICAKHGVKYVYYPTLWENLVSCYTRLKHLSTKDMLDMVKHA